MPKLFTFFGYSIYFWSNENNEPVHVHIAKRPSEKATKVWLTASGDVLLASNLSKIPKKELKLILQYIRANWYIAVNEWLKRFGSIRFYI